MYCYHLLRKLRAGGSARRWANDVEAGSGLGLGTEIRWADWKTRCLEAYGSVETSEGGGLNARKD